MEKRTDTNVSKKVVLLVSTMGSFLTPFMGSAVNIALPTIGKELSIDAILLGWIATSYLLVAAVFLVPFGKMGDMYGRKKLFIIGISIFTVSTLLTVMSTSAIMLISFRALQGVGSAMITGTSVAMLTSVYPANERGRVLGINVAAVYLGLTIGPFLGGFLTEHFGWRSIFLAALPLCLAIITLVFWKVKGEWADARGESLDLVGITIYGLAIIAVMYGLTLLPALSAVWIIVAGVIGIWVLIKWEMRVKSPVLNVNLFRNNRTFIFSNLAALINYSATFAVGFLLSLYLQYVRGFSPQGAGLILVSMPVVQTIFAPIAGRLSDKIEPRIVASAGMALTTVALTLLSFLSEDTEMGLILVSLVIIGFGIALFSSPNTNAVLSSVEKRFYGVSSSILGTMRQLGMALSMGIAMVIFSIYFGRVQITPEYYSIFVRSLQVAFAVFATLCFGGIFASYARGKIR